MIVLIFGEKMKSSGILVSLFFLDISIIILNADFFFKLCSNSLNIEPIKLNSISILCLVIILEFVFKVFSLYFFFNFSHIWGIINT